MPAPKSEMQLEMDQNISKFLLNVWNCFNTPNSSWSKPVKILRLIFQTFKTWNEFPRFLWVNTKNLSRSIFILVRNMFPLGLNKNYLKINNRISEQLIEVLNLDLSPTRLKVVFFSILPTTGILQEGDRGSPSPVPTWHLNTGVQKPPRGTCLCINLSGQFSTNT